MDRAYSPINNLLEQAACIARRSKETAGEIEPTEGYKRRQINELIKFTNNRLHSNVMIIFLLFLKIQDIPMIPNRVYNYRLVRI